MRLATCLSSLRNSSPAESVYSFVQAKVLPHAVGRVHPLLPLTDALKHLRGEVVVFHVFDTLLDDFAEVIRFRAASLGSKKIQSLLKLRGKSDGGR